MREYESRVLTRGLVFGEGPRWHGNRLWVSDMHGQRVVTVDLYGAIEEVVKVPNDPSGLGWTPDGRLLIVSMKDFQLLAWDGAQLTPYADLQPLCGGTPNDMVVDARGRAYVGNFGFDMYGGEMPRAADLVCVDTDGTPRVVASDLHFPNGTVLAPDGRTLIVAETWASRLTAFDVKPADGTLSNRRVFAELPERTPDGICLDAEGAVWVACFANDEFVRVLEGGALTHRVAIDDRRAVACMLGGADRRTLFLLTADTSIEDLAKGQSLCWVETAQVDVPGAGLP